MYFIYLLTSVKTSPMKIENILIHNITYILFIYWKLLSKITYENRKYISGENLFGKFLFKMYINIFPVLIIKDQLWHSHDSAANCNCHYEIYYHMTNDISSMKKNICLLLKIDI